MFRLDNAALVLLLLGVGGSWRPLFAGEVQSAVRNAGFESADSRGVMADGWSVGLGGGAEATVVLDERVRHSGRRSVRIHNESRFRAGVYALVSSRPIGVEANTTYLARFYVKGRGVRMCYVAVGFAGNGGERRQGLPGGDFDWREVTCRFTTPEHCRNVILRFGSDDVTDALWIDDVSVERAAVQLTNLKEPVDPKSFAGFFPRIRGPLPRRLVVFDLSNRYSGPPGHDMDFTITCLQGIVNRTRPRLYLINKTNPPYYDEVWLRWLQEKGYTGPEERVNSLLELIRRFREETTGVIVYDPALPGSLHAARMLAGLKRALPVSPQMLAELNGLHLPVVMDLRGKWQRNVEAYQFIYADYWDRMNHRVLCWKYPLTVQQGGNDYLVAFNVFCFWVSDYDDNEQGADPAAEEAFVDTLLAHTPGNVPVMGWPNYADHIGIQEYSAVRWISEYGKFFPGTEFCTNMTIHSAVHPAESVFRQRFRAHPSAVQLEPGKVYVSVNILDSGDGVWYHQFHQRKIWADPLRGTVPVGFCMNPQIFDLMPAVAQWYFENATENEELFGFIYANMQVYADRFRRQDRERLRNEFAGLTAEYCRRLDFSGIEVYTGGWGSKTPPTPKTLRRFVDAMPGLDYILADLGRHENIAPDRANTMLGSTAVFHCLTRYQVWSSSAETERDDMAAANKWLLNEIVSHTPKERPAFMSAMAVSWYYYPTWLKDLQEKLPDEYVVVAPHDLARLYRQYTAAHRRRRGMQPRREAGP